MLKFQRKKKQKILMRQRENVKNEIISRSLQEGNELDALRREKRQILEEEKRLKAMIQIEKVNAHRKADRIKAERANSKRREEKRRRRRLLNKESIDKKKMAEKEVLRIKHNIQGPPDNTFSSYAY